MSKEPEILLVPIKERYCLNRSGSLKETFHIVLDNSECPLNYQVGDCIGVFPPNDSVLVAHVLKHLGLTGREQIVTRNDSILPLQEALEKKYNLIRPTKKFLSVLVSRLKDASQKEQLLEVIHRPAEFLNEFLESSTIPHLLAYYPSTSWDAQEAVSTLGPLLPRYYSIASSQRAVGNEIHLTVGVTRFKAGATELTGLCSDFLCFRAPLHQPLVPIFLHKAKDFTLTEQSNRFPLIMIGPGTGIAPFRGFIQERLHTRSSNKNWLFFGEQRKDKDFYYEEFWAPLVKENFLRLSLAFSRDQEQKIYVQHRMLEHASDFWQWLQEGAFLFVCGDAKKMAKEVEQTLLKIISEKGNKSEEESKSFIKELRRSGRYVRDVY